jgi:hypothetical protein
VVLEVYLPGAVGFDQTVLDGAFVEPLEYGILDGISI